MLKKLQAEKKKSEQKWNKKENEIMIQWFLNQWI